MTQLTQKMNVYYHKDFDGIVAAALFTVILMKSTEYKEFEYNGVDYDIKDIWLEIELDKPAAILDFLYHPKADYFFDHHITSFVNHKDKNNYQDSEKKRWDTSFKSTPSLLFSCFGDKLDISEYIDLISWADKIDSAQYESPFEIYNNQNEYMLLNKLINKFYRNKKELELIINAIISRKVKYYLKDKEKVLDIINSNEENWMDELSERIEIIGNICYFDQSDLDIPFQRYLSYYYHPEIDYTVAIFKKINQYSVSIGYNPWKHSNMINLGNLANKFGGGGRQNVGGILVESHKKALGIVKDIIKGLNKSDLTR